MSFDLVIRNGRIIDGSGAPSFRGDVAIADGKIVELGKMVGPARRVIDAAGAVVAPGFVDNHCHYDAQITWDPLCTFSCFHGATTVIIGNCSLTLAPARSKHQERLAGMLSAVEAIPMEALEAGIQWRWETFPNYMSAVEKRLGVNVGMLIGHSALRLYAMGDRCHQSHATDTEMAAMRDALGSGLQAGALGLSITRNMRHLDIHGKNLPSACAVESELFDLAGVLTELGTGVIQCGGGETPELKTRLLSRLGEASGRRVMYNALTEKAQNPGQWKVHLDHVKRSARDGSRATPLCCPTSISQRFTMNNCPVFVHMPHWKEILKLPDNEKTIAFADSQVRAQLQADLDASTGPDVLFRDRWDLMWIEQPQLEKNRHTRGKSVAQLAASLSQQPLDVFLDLAVEENLKTVFVLGQVNTDPEAMTEILLSPHAVVGLSDGGAHVQYESTVGVSTRLLGYWVREKGIMSLEQAIRRLTFDSASAYGIYDRGLLRPGLAADIVVFDPDLINMRAKDIVHDFPNDAWRVRELAEGIHYTIVNGEVLMEAGTHTGALPGRVVRNTYWLRERSPIRAVVTV